MDARWVLGLLREKGTYVSEWYIFQKTKQMFKSPLDEIDGIGSKRKKALLSHFGSAKAIEGASLDDIKSIDGINDSSAEKVYNFFHKKKNIL